ncbi:hypothetical protein RRF57_005094 [Xylaria bambusicola]|uniref:Uncharacterized protein n=1 Tax=Xylaria bambusicola TaxID=326684 RepID=A0AAN7UKJ7_9PEZI
MTVESTAANKAAEHPRLSLLAGESGSASPVDSGDVSADGVSCPLSPVEPLETALEPVPDGASTADVPVGAVVVVVLG